MKPELLKKYDWKDIPFLTGGSQLEINLFQDIPALLEKLMPGYVFGVFTFEDMDHRRALGWEPLPPEKLGENWKTEAPLGFVTQFSDHGGYLTIKKKVLCYMPKEINKELHKELHRRSEARFRGASGGAKAEAQKRVASGAAVDESELEVQTQKPGEGIVNETKKRGRPRKNG